MALPENNVVRPDWARGLKPPGGGGTLDGMDPWQQSVETRLGQLHTDVRDVGKKVDANLYWMMGGFGAVILAGVSMFIAVTGKIDQSVDRVSAKIEASAPR